MLTIHPDASRFLCSQCKTPTRCNDLIASDGPGRDFCAGCLHVESIREIYQTRDHFTNHHHRGEGPSQNPYDLEGPDIEW
jgi:hypothetical protein